MCVFAQHLSGDTLLHDKALHSPASSMTSLLFHHLLRDIFCYSVTHSIIVLFYHCSLYYSDLTFSSLGKVNPKYRLNTHSCTIVKHQYWLNYNTKLLFNQETSNRKKCLQFFSTYPSQKCILYSWS